MQACNGYSHERLAAGQQVRMNLACSAWAEERSVCCRLLGRLWLPEVLARPGGLELHRPDPAE